MTAAAVVFLVALILFVVERVAPARAWPDVVGWWPRAILLNTIQASAVFVAGVGWDRWFQQWSVWRLDLGDTAIGGAFVGYIVITFVFYWWHRARHDVPLLWRFFHQVHHSPQRIEILTSFYKHPAEIFGNSILSSAILYLLCGLDPESAALAVLVTGLAELFYHWNIKTPYWLGFIIQRPERHCVHHRTGWHRQNFADLPVWDMMFGTFHNPRQADAFCGFEDGLENRLGAMLQAVDLHAGRPANLPNSRAGE